MTKHLSPRWRIRFFRSWFSLAVLQRKHPGSFSHRMNFSRQGAHNFSKRDSLSFCFLGFCQYITKGCGFQDFSSQRTLKKPFADENLECSPLGEPSVQTGIVSLFVSRVRVQSSILTDKVWDLKKTRKPRKAGFTLRSTSFRTPKPLFQHVLQLDTPLKPLPI
jgi:hypothetical protein